MPPALEHHISGQGGNWIQQPPSTGAPPCNSALGKSGGGLWPSTGTGKGLEEDTERSWSSQSTLGPKSRCHLQTADVKQGLGRAAAGGAPLHGQSPAPGKAAGLTGSPGLGQRDRLPGEGRKSPEPQCRDGDSTHSCPPGGRGRAPVPPAGREPRAGSQGRHLPLGLLFRFKMQRLVAWLAFCLQVQMGRRLTLFPHLESCTGNPRRRKREREEDFPVSAFISFTLSLHYKVQRVSNITSTGPCKWHGHERALARINLSMYRCSLLTLLFSLGGYCGKTPD